MARTGRGWDAKPPAPKRQPTSSADSSAPEQPSGRRRSLPWSDRDIAPDPTSAEAPILRASSLPPPDSADSPVRRGKSLPWSDRDASAGAEVPAADSGSRRRGGRSQQWSKADTPGEKGAVQGRRGEREETRDPEEVAREICLRQLAVRPRTRAELEIALKKKGVSDEVARALLDRYGEVGIIDDAAFARAWVTSRHESKGLASRALAQELRRKGVDQEVASEALSELDSDTEAQTALDLALRKLRTTRGEPEAVFRRLVGMLARKGYPGSVAFRAVKEALATRDAALAELIDPDAYEE